MPQEQLDPQVVALAKSIRKIESGGNFTARGKTGEYGAYQYMPDTWNQWSKQYLGRNVPLEKATPAEQNEVAYKKIKEMKDRGFNVGQVASSWNAGEGRKDAYREGFKGVNSKGVAFDTGAYAEKVAREYQQLKNQGPMAGGTYPAPPQVTPFQAETAPEKQKGLGRKVAEFLLPVLEEKERTPLQWAGDIGLSALTLLPGAGLAAKGLRGAGLLAKAAPVASKAPGIMGLAAQGAKIGYAADVASDLSRGETDIAKIATPGFGTAVGGIGGGALGVASKYATSALSGTSGVPKAALELSAERAPKVSGLLKRGASPKEARDIATGAVKTLRNSMSEQWRSGVDDIVKKYTGRRVGLPERIAAEFKDIASRYNTATKTRITIPQNPQNMSAKELTDAIRDLNAIKYNKLQPDRALLDMKKYLKGLGKGAFNDGGEFSTLYSNYATKSEILEAADDIVRAFNAKKPTNATTAINRLQSVFNDGKEEYLKAIQALERETGVDILSHVASGKVAPRLPQDPRAGIGIDDVLRWAGFFVSSPRAADSLNKLLTQGTATGLVTKTMQTGAKLAPVVPGLLER